MRSLLLAAGLAALAPTDAMANEWYRVGGNDETMSYVDLDSLRPLGSKTIAITLSVYSSPMSDNVWGVAIRSEYDCQGNYFRTLEYTFLDIDGGYLYSEPSETINERKVPAEGSLNESMMEFICYRRGGEFVTDPFDDADQMFGF